MKSIGQKYATYLKLKLRLSNKWTIRLMYLQLCVIVLFLGIPGWLLSPRNNEAMAWQNVEVVNVSQISRLTPASEITVSFSAEDIRWGFQHVRVAIYEGLGSAATEKFWSESFTVFFSSTLWSNPEVVLSDINFRPNHDYMLRIYINDRPARITQGGQVRTQIALSS